MYSQPIPALNKPNPKKNPSHAAARFPFALCHSQKSAASVKITRGNSEKGANPKTVSRPRQKAIMSFTENFTGLILSIIWLPPYYLKLLRDPLSSTKMQMKFFMSIVKSLMEVRNEN